MSIGRGLRFRVFQDDDFTCRYCGRRPPEVTLEVEHVVPRARGGSDRRANLVTSCYDCNHGKGVREGILPPPGAHGSPAAFPTGRRFAHENHQGVVEQVVIGGAIVRLFSWLDGEPSNETTFLRADEKWSGWRFYSNDERMDDEMPSWLY